MSAILVELFKHNVWANLSLLNACADLTDEQLNASVPGTFGSIADTLAHIVDAEERYVARLSGVEPKNPIGVDQPFPGLGDLRQRARHCGEALVDLAARTRPQRVLPGVWRGEPYAIPAPVLLIQAINHATEHRAQVATIMTQQGVQPPDLDGWTYWDKVLKA